MIPHADTARSVALMPGEECPVPCIACGTKRMAYRVPLSVCPDGHVSVAGNPAPAWQVLCPGGHWAWEDGNYCPECGDALR